MGIESAIIGSAVIGGGLGLLGAKSQSDAAKKAAKAQQKGADAATQAQLEMYYQTREDMAPWREAGLRGLEGLEGWTKTYEDVIKDPTLDTKSPAYDFLLNEGISALDRSAIARGKGDSGEHAKDVIRYGEGFAAADYGSYLDRLGSLMNRYAGTAGVGQTATNYLANIGADTASQIGANNILSANAQAGGYINQANARTGLYNNLSNIGSNAVNQYMLYDYLKNMGGNQFPNVPTIRGGQGGGYGW